MVFPVCVGERWLPWRRCTGWGWWAGPEKCAGPVTVTAVERVERVASVERAAPGYEIAARAVRTLALISAGIGA